MIKPSASPRDVGWPSQSLEWPLWSRQCCFMDIKFPARPGCLGGNIVGSCRGAVSKDDVNRDLLDESKAAIIGPDFAYWTPNPITLDRATVLRTSYSVRKISN